VYHRFGNVSQASLLFQSIIYIHEQSKILCMKGCMSENMTTSMLSTVFLFFKGENLHIKGPHLWRAVDMHRIMILSNQARQGPGTQGL